MSLTPVFIAPRLSRAARLLTSGPDILAHIENVLAHQPTLGRRFVHGIPTIRALPHRCDCDDGDEVLTWIYAFLPLADAFRNGEDHVLLLYAKRNETRGVITPDDTDALLISASIKEIYDTMARVAR